MNNFFHRGCAMLLALVAANATAQLPPSLPEQAQQQLANGDPAAAARLLDEALAQPGTTKATRVQLLPWRGETAVALGDAVAAQQAFTRWLMLDPQATAPAGLSPEARNLLDAVKADYAARSAVVITHMPPPAGRRGENIAVEFRVEDVFGRVAVMEAHVHAILCGRPTRATRVPLNKGARVDTQQVFWGELRDPALETSGNIPPGYVVEYRVVATTEDGDVVEPSGGQPVFRITVGDAAASSCTAAAPPREHNAEEASGMPGPLRWMLGLVGGGVLGAGALVLLTVGLAGGAGTGMVVFCSVNRIACNLPRDTSTGRVEVRVESRGGPQ